MVIRVLLLLVVATIVLAQDESCGSFTVGFQGHSCPNEQSSAALSKNVINKAMIQAVMEISGEDISRADFLHGMSGGNQGQGEDQGQGQGQGNNNSRYLAETSGTGACQLSFVQ